ncbi:MAG: DUF262 domain-containing protein [Microthrixaceae bacterium]
MEQIERGDYVLPAIQREFVWSADQIVRLFDSMMRDYPIGTFLLWEVQPEHVSQYGFYEFVADFDVRTPHNDRAKVAKGRGVTAVLDGQQRLTALNIALHGSYTDKLPRRRWNDPTAFPKRHLYAHLTELDHEAGAEETKFRFEFLSKDQLNGDPNPSHWLRVADVLGMDPASVEPFKLLQERELADNEDAFSTLNRLVHLVNRDLLVNYYLERSNDLDKVLNIFIRVNSGGTVLSYSDLLLSVATALWKGDAREEIYVLTDQLNDIGGGFAFSKDRVLKAALVLTDQADIKFKVDNFTAANVRLIETEWDAIASALRVATMMLARFGLSAESLTAQNVLIPIAYYAKHRGLSDADVIRPQLSDDREKIRSFVIRSLLRAGFWTGAVDTILLRSRDVIRAEGAKGFPLEAIEKSLLGAGKSLVFSEEEIEDLVWTPYGNRAVFLLLTLLYPGVDVANVWHVDHVYPKSLFTKRKLTALGITGADATDWAHWVNLLPNLQLLEGLHNETKSAMLPTEWVKTLPSKSRSHYLEHHDLAPLPDELSGFEAWWDTRAERMEERLQALLTKAP